MKRAALSFVCVVLASPAALRAQISDRCSPGWSTLNRLREQLTPDISTDTLQLLKVRIEKDLTNCREIPDLWYYRALVDDRLKDTKDAAYARKQADAGNSEALRAKANPFEGVREQPSSLPAKLGQKYALVVGINDFEHAPALHYAVNDARGVADLLSSPDTGRFQDGNVYRLFDGQATLTAVKTAIGTIRQRAKPEDLVVVYIASHGSPRESDPNGVSYVLMHDTKIDNAADLYASSLQMIDLVNTLQKDMQAKRVVLILDTCFSGDATGSRGITVHSAEKSLGSQAEFSVAVDKVEDKTAQGAARVIISASRADEPSREDDSLQHGYFTYYLLDSLKKNAGGSPLNDVFQSVHDQVAKAVRDRFGASQSPTLRGTPEGLQIVLGAPAGQ